MTAPTLSGPRVALRALSDGDRERLGSILAQPEIARWWGPESAEQAAAEWGVGPNVTSWAITIRGVIVGSIQAVEELDPDCRHAGIDLFIDAAHQGRGIGPEAIRLEARHLFADRGHHRITIDPAAANQRAIAAYARVGFRAVGIMRDYERGSDGTWHDGLLMDLLAGELR